LNSIFFSKTFQPHNQGLRVERISKKTRGQKSGDTVPLIVNCSNFYYVLSHFFHQQKIIFFIKEENFSFFSILSLSAKKTVSTQKWLDTPFLSWWQLDPHPPTLIQSENFLPILIQFDNFLPTLIQFDTLFFTLTQLETFLPTLMQADTLFFTLTQLETFLPTLIQADTLFLPWPS